MSDALSTARRGLRRPTVAAVAGMLLLGTLTGTSTAAAAPATVNQPTVQVVAGDYPNATMGSQIRRVEGDHSTDRTKADALRPQGLNSDGFDAYATVPGIDVASYQGDVDWASMWSQGKRFAYVKATEGTYYTNPYFAQQYDGSYNTGMVRGAYHFGTPNTTGGAAQADYFVAHGGGWSGDGKTLPGALDMEYNPYGATCYGLSQAAMTSWILSFHDEYHARTGRWPVIYTSADWWSQCVGNGDFSSTAPLWVARYASSAGTLPYGWGFYTFWQYSSSPIDQDVFNGAFDRLQVLATG